MQVSNCTNHSPCSFASSKLKMCSSAIKTTSGKGEAMLDYLQALGQNNILGINKVKAVDIPIKSEDEYNEVIKRILAAKKPNGYDLVNKDALATYYSNISDKELGLLPYCGEQDVSANINLYLSGRLKDPVIFERWKAAMLPEDLTVDVIRALDYSLKNLDSEFGKYKGIVFRQGFMGENVGQFFSTSKNPSIVGQMNNGWLYFNPDRGYSVIRTSNGHNICEFQKKMGTEFANTEEEILIPRTGVFSRVKESDMDDEMINARDRLASKLFFGADMLVNGELKECNGYTKKDLLKLINVFDEIKA